MGAYIKYGDFVFEDPQPFVSSSEEMIEASGRLTVFKNITIDGQITGSSADELYKKRYNLITGLSKSYKQFLVIEDSSGIIPKTSSLGTTDAHGNVDSHYWPRKEAYGHNRTIGDSRSSIPAIQTGDSSTIPGVDVIVSGAYTKVDDIDFDSHQYFSDGGFIGYSVSMSCYNPEDFSTLYNITEPTETLDYSETEQNIIEISHKISAKGLNSRFEDVGNSGNALINAKNWVKARTGDRGGQLWTELPPLLMSGRNISNAVLMSQNESIDRMSATYSVDETWQYNPSGNTTDTSFQKYSFAYASGATDDYISVDVELEVVGGLDADLATLRNEIPSVETIRGQATGAINYSALSTMHGSYKVKEDPDSRSINISVSFDNNTGDYDANPAGLGYKPWFDYEISMDQDDITNVSTISLNGDLKLRKNQLYTWSAFKSYFDDTITKTYLYELATGHFADLNQENHDLNPNPSSYSITEKSGDPSISVNITFSDADWVTGYSDAGYSISQTPSIAQFKPKASAIHNGEWIVPYLGYYNREKIGFNYDFTMEGSLGNPAYGLEVPYYIAQWNPMQYIDSLKAVLTGAGFNHPQLNSADTLYHPVQANQFHGFGIADDQLTANDKYNVRLTKENSTVQSGSASNTMSYSYEWTKPANTNISIKIP